MLCLQVAAEAGKSPAQVLLRWNMQRGVPVIPKASNPDHIADNIQVIFHAYKHSVSHVACASVHGCRWRQ